MRKVAALLGAFALSAGALQVASAQSHVLIVTGLGGEPRFSDTFFELGKSLAESARSRHGVAPGNIVFLSEDPARDPSVVSGRSTRENVEKEIRRIAAVTGANDHVIIALIGHGTSQGAEGRFNLPGVDINSLEYAELLQVFNANQHVAFLNLSSASGDFIKPLSAPGRVVITATKTGFERNETLFPSYFVASFAQDGADSDKDGRVSLLEAFEYGRLEVARFYEDDGRLLTEHAMLDDNGDGTGTHEPDPRAEGGDGAFARAFHLGGFVAAEVAASNPRLAQLYRERAELESRIEALRRVKDTMGVAEYESQLEKLLVDLALKNKEIRDLGGGGA